MHFRVGDCLTSMKNFFDSGLSQIVLRMLWLIDPILKCCMHALEWNFFLSWNYLSFKMWFKRKISSEKYRYRFIKKNFSNETSNFCFCCLKAYNSDLNKCTWMYKWAFFDDVLISIMSSVCSQGPCVSQKDRNANICKKNR